MRLARSMTESVVGRLVGRLVGTVAAVVQCELFLKRVLELVIHCTTVARVKGPKQRRSSSTVSLPAMPFSLWLTIRSR